MTMRRSGTARLAVLAALVALAAFEVFAVSQTDDRNQCVEFDDGNNDATLVTDGGSCARRNVGEVGGSREADGETLALPAGGGEGVHRIELGETVQLDNLGPIIVNSDGTTRRITNWNLISERERAWTLHRISKRNKERISAFSEKNDIPDSP